MGWRFGTNGTDGTNGRAGALDEHAIDLFDFNDGGHSVRLAPMKLESAGSSGQPPPSSEVSLPGGHRRRWFRLFAVSLPVLVLVIVEICLRMAGYGYATSF